MSDLKLEQEFSVCALKSMLNVVSAYYTTKYANEYINKNKNNPCLFVDMVNGEFEDTIQKRVKTKINNLIKGNNNEFYKAYNHAYEELADVME